MIRNDVRRGMGRWGTPPIPVSRRASVSLAVSLTPPRGAPRSCAANQGNCSCRVEVSRPRRTPASARPLTTLPRTTERTASPFRQKATALLDGRGDCWSPRLLPTPPSSMKVPSSAGGVRGAVSRWDLRASLSGPGEAAAGRVSIVCSSRKAGCPRAGLGRVRQSPQLSLNEAVEVLREELRSDGLSREGKLRDWRSLLCVWPSG